MPQSKAQPPKDAQRQIVLPLSKAVEIAYKSIRQRLSRSLLVTSGIVLALAFLMSILANDALIGGMRSWITAAKDPKHRPPEFAQLEKQKAGIDQKLAGLEAQLKSPDPASTETPVDFDIKSAFDLDWQEFQREAGGLPAPSSSALTDTLKAHPSLVPVLKDWFKTRQDLRGIVEQLNGAQFLEAKMRDSGVPTTPEEIAAEKTQTHWLVGLALLVAFVGILNAMLMSVTERFREIGTMKCLGALDSFIIKLFLIESLFQGVVGTVIGVGIGLLLSVISTWSNYGNYTWRNVPVASLAGSVGVCLLVGVFLTVAGAVYPAWQAARMQPIEAMRAET